MEPSEVAGIIIERVVDYCTNISGDTVLDCLEYHSPDQLDTFVDMYLTEEEDNELQKEIDKSEKFWDEVKKEYEKLWEQEMDLELDSYADDTRDYLADTLSMLYENIIQNDELSDTCKARRLKAYAEVLEEFGNAINRALKDGESLSDIDLDYWYRKIGDIAFGVKNYNYYDEIDPYIYYYDNMSKNKKLEVLSALLDEIGNVLYDIEHKLPELEGLTNNNS
ncbi:hypothetical protein [Sulfolobus monocaudavirus SMV3]|uniref:hypothetical protein n=1 Tax=Sulfolobus monocaudavirus SMV3 TaxID=1732177 RepID=UPI000706BC36|nr:hypothetical protein AXI69_gp02 [Sulfolobus monocaudavirus SMV3]ALG96939.1 hypothetical protein [Sulfolobus monocaudavirus SMV3]